MGRPGERLRSSLGPWFAALSGRRRFVVTTVGLVVVVAAAAEEVIPTVPVQWPACP